jgi:hypothetical protein
LTTLWRLTRRVVAARTRSSTVFVAPRIKGVPG